MDIWVSVSDCISLPTMPTTRAGVLHRAKLENWESRKKEKGKGVEYKIDCLPPVAIASYLKKHNKIQLGNKIIDVPEKKEKNYCAEALWANFDKSTDKQKEKAKIKTAIVIATKTLINSGVDVLTAFETVATTHECSTAKVRRWFYQVKGYETADYLPVLIDKHNTRDFSERKAEITPKAWDFFKADYFRLEQPALRTCYQRLCEAAKAHGWTVPSLSSLRRKIEKEVSTEHKVLWRKGEHALMMLYPAQQRTVEDLDAMEWINGDGYLHNVFVKWYNGEIIRPKTWVWQDIRTRKIIGYRVDISENSDMIRLALSDVIENYGIPKHITIDNTRAALING